MADPFGRALLDHHRGDRESPLRQRDGEAAKTHPVGGFYFSGFEDQPDHEWIESWIEGPLVDLGAGAGRDALHFQEAYGTVALEASDRLVTLLDERGIDDARHGDMFAPGETFESDRFRSALALGTQVGLAKSLPGLQAFLDDLAAVTTADATAVIDAYDPDYGDADEMLGFRADPTPGLAYRVIYYEYDGHRGDTLLFRLFGPDRLREAVAGTNWSVAEVRRPHDAYYYRAALAKERVRSD